MSFSTETKNDLAHIQPEKDCCTIAEISGFICMCGNIQGSENGGYQITMATDHAAIARHYKTLIKDGFGIDAALDVQQGKALKRKNSYTLSITQKEPSQRLLEGAGILRMEAGAPYLSDGIAQSRIKTKCCKKAYLRGCFLAVGAISHPEKGYHLEYSCPTQVLAKDMKRLINSFADLHAAISKRKKSYPVYVKENSQIFDMLAIMGAHSKALVLEDVRMKKELRNRTNRLRNCDSANIDKTVQAAEKQLAWIKIIQDTKGLGSLPPQLHAVAILRLDHPESSLQELAEKMDPPMKKSGLNHRFQKIEALAEQLRK